MPAHYYKVDIKWEKGRTGQMCSPEVESNDTNNHRCLSVATPPEFPKGVPGMWSPEHLFTAAVSSCLMTTFLAVAENSKLEFVSFQCRSEGKLEQVDGKFLMTEVNLAPEITILHEHDREKAMRVLQRSEAACLISKSVKARVSMTPSVDVVSGGTSTDTSRI